MLIEAKTAENEQEQSRESGAGAGYIYFFISADCKAVKIGFSANPQMRLANYRTAHYEDVAFEDIFPGDKADEATIHAILNEHHICREWFGLEGVMEWLEGIQDRRIELNLERFGDPNLNEISISELI